MMISLIAEQIKDKVKILYKIIKFFHKPLERYNGTIKDELNLSSYATKVDLRIATDLDTTNLAVKSAFASYMKQIKQIQIN